MYVLNRSTGAVMPLHRAQSPEPVESPPKPPDWPYPPAPPDPSPIGEPPPETPAQFAGGYRRCPIPVLRR